MGCWTSFISFIWKFQTEEFPQAHVLSPQLKRTLKAQLLLYACISPNRFCLFKSGNLQGGAGMKVLHFYYLFLYSYHLPGLEWLWPLSMEKWQGPWIPTAPTNGVTIPPHTISLGLWSMARCQRPVEGGAASGTRGSLASLTTAFGLFLSTCSKMLTFLHSLLARHTSIQK